MPSHIGIRRTYALAFICDTGHHTCRRTHASYISLHTWSHMSSHVSSHAVICDFIHVVLNIFACSRTCSHACSHTCSHTCGHTCSHTCRHICTSSHTCRHICRHTCRHASRHICRSYMATHGSVLHVAAPNVMSAIVHAGKKDIVITCQFRLKRCHQRHTDMHVVAHVGI